MPFQRKALASAHFHPSDRNEEQARLSDEAGDLIQPARLNRVLVQSQSPSKVAFPHALGHCEHQESFKQADFKQPATSNLHTRPSLHADDHGMATPTTVPPQEESNGALISQWGTNHPGLNSEQNINIGDAGTPASVTAQEAGQFTIAAAPLQTYSSATTAVSANSAVNTLARWVGITNTMSATMNAVASAFRTAQGQPNNAVTLWPVKHPERTIKQGSTPSLLNEHLAHNQKVPAPKLRRHDGQNGSKTGCSSDVLDRPRSVRPSNSVAGASKPIPAEQHTSHNLGNKNQCSLFDGLHPSRLPRISNKEQPQHNGTSAQPKAPSPTPSIIHPGSGQNGKVPKDDSRQEKNKKEGSLQGTRKRCGENDSSTNTIAKRSKLELSYTMPQHLDLNPTLKNLETVGKSFFVEGDDNMTKKYRQLQRGVRPEKEWCFAWKEIITILRSPESFNCVEWQKFFSAELQTNFKLFGFRGPFTKRGIAKQTVIKKAVLHVIDGPFFFEEAAPALEGMLYFAEINPPRSLTLSHGRLPKS